MELGKVGDRDDGGVYVGKSATDGKDLHVTLTDEPEYLTFDEAFEAAARMRKLPGRENAHVPTLAELNENLFENRNTGLLKGTFNTSGSYPEGVYRSSASYDDIYAWVQFFDVGDENLDTWDTRLPVRLVW